MTNISKNISQLIETLNEKQKSYVNFDMENSKNGEYLLAAFHLVPNKKYNILHFNTIIEKK